MSRHNQRPTNRLMTCLECQNDNCEECIDTLRSKYSSENICACERLLHEVTVKLFSAEGKR